MKKKPRIAVLLSESTRNRVMTSPTIARIKKIGTTIGFDSDKMDPEIAKRVIKDADAAITGWGTPPLTKEIIDEAPNLGIITHSAGSVKSVTGEEVWKRKIVVTTTASSIAISVAEFTLGSIITGLARVQSLTRDTRAGKWWEADKKYYKGLYNITVGIVSAGFVGRHVISLLKPFGISILVYDPFFSTKDAKKMGVQKATLEKLLANSDVVTLHAPSIPETNHMLNANTLAMMKDGAVLVNTARGTLIDEKALAVAVKERNLYVCIDVTDPEPPEANNPLLNMENVVVTPHIAGAGANLRQGEFVAMELERFFAGKKQMYPVTYDMLKKMA